LDSHEVWTAPMAMNREDEIYLMHARRIAAGITTGE